MPDLTKFQLAEIDRFADRVVDEGLGVGLLHGGHDLGKGDRDGGGELGVEVVRAAVGQVHFAVDDIGVRAGGRAMKRPLEFAEGHRQAAERDVAVGPGIAQALGLGGQVSGHRRQQMRLVEFEGLAQFELQRAALGAAAGRAERPPSAAP